MQGPMLQNKTSLPYFFAILSRAFSPLQDDPSLMSTSTPIRNPRPRHLRRSTRFLWIAALVAVAPMVLAGPQGYYRWKDDKGQFQATQQPPTDRPSEFVRTSTGTASQGSDDAASSPAATPAAGAGDKAAAGGKDAPKSRPLQGVPDKDPEKCKQAQDTLAVLNSHARIREKDDSGEYRYLNPDEITDQKKLADDSIQVYCESGAAQ